MHIVFVPGIGLDHRAYAVTRSFLAGYDTSVLRLPGYGLRAASHADLSPSSLARVVIELIRRRDLERVVLVGHSASCQIVAEAARDGRIIGVVLMGATTDPRASTWPSLIHRWLSTARHEPPRLVPSLVGQYSRTGLVSMTRAMGAARHHDIRGALRRIGKPVALLRGPHDHIAPADWVESLGSVPFASSSTLSAGGHMIPMTECGAVSQHIRSLSDTASSCRSRS